jgi:uncharacterized protein YjgD (DUF1641 family)
MSEQSLTDGEMESLEQAIEENPEAVAAFVRRLDAVNELLDVVALGTEALDDEMVAELTGTAATLAEAGDGLATEETVRLSAAVGENGDDLAAALETLVDLERSGTLDDLEGLAHTVSLLSGALDDDMVVSLASTGNSLGEVADEAADPDTVRGVQTLLRAVGDAGERQDELRPVGAVGLVRALRDPEVKTGMAFLVALARGVGREVERGANAGDGPR